MRALIDANPDLWAWSLERAKSGPRVLMATSVGGHPQFTIVESTLCIALTLRGAKVDTLICDGVLPACHRAKVSEPEPPELVRGGMSAPICRLCVLRGERAFDIPGLDLLRMSAFVSAEDRAAARALADALPADELAGYRRDGVALGEHALSGVLRYYGLGDLSAEPEGEQVLRRFLEAALLTAGAAKRALEAGRYDVVVMNHGVYVPHGVVNAVARRAGVRTVTWNTAYRRQCVIFSHDDTYHHTLIDEPTSAWEDMPWQPAREAEIMAYLHSRRTGERDWIAFNRNADADVDRFGQAVGLDWTRPVIGMLTNVAWDAQLHYPANVFVNMKDWMIKTIAYFKARPDLQLLIRVHPGELAPPGGVTKSRQPAVEEIRRAFPELPPNVFVIPPESSLSTYAVAERCDSVIIYGTKTGVELASLGVPIVVAGEAWIRNKGVTYDVANEADYFARLDRPPTGRRMDVRTTKRARMYAYHFFLRRMIPLPFLDPAEHKWPPFVVRLKRLGQLGAGRYPGLDVICDGVITGSPFVYEAERLGLHDAERA